VFYKDTYCFASCVF